MCDRVGVMRDGSLCEVSQTEQLFTRPEHEYSKHLISLMPKFDMLPELP
jgi:peptide/nickel transport system ATP-binding protein